MNDEYAEWMVEFDDRANLKNGFPDQELDQDLLDELYDAGMSVSQALREYLIRM